MKIKEIMKTKKGIVISFLLGLLVLVGIITLILLTSTNQKYDVEEITSYHYFLLNIENKNGVIDEKGKVIIEPNYDLVIIPNPQKAVFICKNGEKTIAFNENKQELFTNYEQVEAIAIQGITSSLPYEKGALRYKKDGKYGLINFEGKQITKPMYDKIESLTNKEGIFVTTTNGKCGLINTKGKQLIKNEYDTIIGDGFYTQDSKYQLSGYIVSSKTEEGYRYGYIDQKGKKILKTEYNELYRVTEIEDTKNTYLIASKNGQVGVVKNNKVIIPYSYQSIEYEQSSRLFELERNSKLGVANQEGKIVIPVEQEEIIFNGAYINAKKEQEEQFYDKDGNKITDLEYKAIIPTKNETYYLSINKDGYYGVLKNDKKVLVQNKYNYLEYLFDQYFIAANEEGNLGIISSEDKEIVEFKYDVLQKLGDSKIVEAKILASNKTDLYSKELKKVYSQKEATIYLYDSYIQAYSENDIQYFDFDGLEVKNTQIFPENKLFAKKQANQWGFVDKNATIVIDYQYEKVTEFNHYGFAGIKKDNKWGVIAQDGTIIREPIYKLSGDNIEPEFIGEYYKIYFGNGESYYTNKVNK